MLKNLLAILAGLLGLVLRRLERTPEDRAYEAKAAEAKELAKPDRPFDDAVDRL